MVHKTPLGWVLERVRYTAMEIVNEKIEHLIVLKDGIVAHRVVGDEDKVHINPKLTEDSIVIHNHPSELTFSGDDVAVSAEQNCWLAAVVTPYMIGYLERPQGGWPNPKSIYLESFMEGMAHGNDLNTSNKVRDASIHRMAASIGAFYWVEYNWQLNLIELK